MAQFTLRDIGQVRWLSGNVTTLQWIKPGHEAETAAGLGYDRDRLSRGYFVALMTRPPTPDEFQFDGTTLRSGGRDGLPASSREADERREKVHDRVLAERGAEGYRALQVSALRAVRISGPARLAKVLPDIAHDPAQAPDAQYPMGGGGLQWRLLKVVPFLIAAHVDAFGRVVTPGFALDLRSGGYDARARLRRYLEAA